MKHNYWSACETGRVRANNEDTILAEKELGLYVVCDGMGGHSAGEIASETAAQSVLSVIRDAHAILSRVPLKERRGRRQVKRILVAAVQQASATVFRRGSESTQLHGMGTTLSLVLILGRRAFVAHVGDSRIYLLRDQKLHQITEDHSLVNELIKRGHLSSDEVDDLPIKNAVTRAVGIAENVEVDTTDFELLPKDRLLLCSDGLHGYFRSEDGARLLAIEETESIPKACVDFANQRGGKDNISAIVVEMGQGDDGQSKHFQLGMEVLRRQVLLSGMSYRQVATIMDTVEPRTLARGEAIFTRQSPPAIAFILTGSVSIRRGPAIIRELTPGQILGLRALASNWGTEEYIAERPLTLLQLKREDLLSLAQQDPQLGSQFFWNLAQLLAIKHEEWQGDGVELQPLSDDRETVSSHGPRDDRPGFGSRSEQNWARESNLRERERTSPTLARPRSGAARPERPARRPLSGATPRVPAQPFQRPHRQIAPQSPTASSSEIPHHLRGAKTITDELDYKVVDPTPRKRHNSAPDNATEISSNPTFSSEEQRAHLIDDDAFSDFPTRRQPPPFKK